jgi:hypothetical protein
VGALFAVPLTLLVKSMLIDVDGRASWVGPLLDGAPAPSPVADDPDGREERGAEEHGAEEHGAEEGPVPGAGPSAAPSAGLSRPSRAQ